MLAYRWLLGLILAGLGGAFVVLSVVASGFRKSFTGTGANPLTTIVPVAAMLILLGGLIAPGNRTLLHMGAAAAVGLLGLCVWLMVSEKAVSVWWGVFYLLGWLYFYWKSAAPQSMVK